MDNARPDRWGERVIRRFEPSPRLSILEFLLFAGDDRYGALGVSLRADAYAPWRSGPMPGLDSLQEMAEVVKKVLANEAVPEWQQRLVKPGASLGGARPKSLITIGGEPWLVKFSEGEEIDTPLIEHATMELARSCGIEAATTGCRRRSMWCPAPTAWATRRWGSATRATNPRWPMRCRRRASSG